MNESARYWIDSNNNKWSKADYSEETAAKASASLVNCHKCIDCECCRDCSSCNGCTNCISCNKLFCCNDCAYCNDCTYCCFTAFRTNYANVSLLSAGYVDAAK